MSLVFIFMLINVRGHPVVVYPAGGEHFQGGEAITFKWKIAIEHEQDNWDLYFSPDGGITWEEIALDINPEILEYTWTLPDITTSHAQFRIVMDNVEGIMDYEDISYEFMIMSDMEVTSIRKEPSKDQDFNNMPNPFSEHTLIRFSLDRGSDVSLDVFSATGVRIENLISEYLNTGVYEISWEATGRSSGIYFCRLSTADFISTRRMILVR